MRYQKIEFAQFPHVYFAHGYKTEKYSLHFMPEEDCIEITYIEQGDIVQTFKDGRKLELHAPGVLVNIRNCEYKIESCSPIHRHSTICFIVDFKAKDISANEVIEFNKRTIQMQDGKTLTGILPECFEVDRNNSHIEKQIKQIIRTHSEQTSVSYLSCSGMILNLIGEITEECIRNAMNECDSRFSFGSIVYSRRAMQYVARHLDRKICIADIAKELEISSGYLSNSFKSVTGQTLVDYINRAKLDRVKEILTTNPFATLKQAGESVGIYDENYLSRIFKKYTGITVREYKMLQVKID